MYIEFKAPQRKGLSKVFKFYFLTILVGGGSAGSVIANRLARNAHDRVLVLEAGKNTVGLLQIPSVGLLLQGTQFDWSYKTVPQQNACLALKNNVRKIIQIKISR